MGDADLHGLLGELHEGVQALQAEIDEKEAEVEALRERQSDMYRRMADVAQQIAASIDGRSTRQQAPPPRPLPHRPAAPRPAPKPVLALPGAFADEEPPEEPLADITDREWELLKLYSQNPGAGYGQLATELYGQDTRTARINVASFFSRMKAKGFVEAIGQGQFRITEKGEAALNAK